MSTDRYKIVDALYATIMQDKLPPCICSDLQAQGFSASTVLMEDLLEILDQRYQQLSFDHLESYLMNFGDSINSIQDLLVAWQDIHIVSTQANRAFTATYAITILSSVINKLGHNDIVVAYNHKLLNAVNPNDRIQNLEQFIQFVLNEQNILSYKSKPILKPSGIIQSATETASIREEILTLTKSVNNLTKQVGAVIGSTGLPMPTPPPQPIASKHFCSTHGPNGSHNSDTCKRKSALHSNTDTLIAWTNQAQWTAYAAARKKG